MRTRFFANTTVAMVELVLLSFSFTCFCPVAMRMRIFGTVVHVQGIACFATPFLASTGGWRAIGPSIMLPAL